jgi:hypothetical protein
MYFSFWRGIEGFSRYNTQLTALFSFTQGISIERTFFRGHCGVIIDTSNIDLDSSSCCTGKSTF